MKRKIILLIGLHIVALCLLIGISVFATSQGENLSLRIRLGESHAGKTNIAQLYYSDDTSDWKKNSPLTVTYEDDEIVFSLSGIDVRKNRMRIEPFHVKEDFSVVSVSLVCDDHTLWTCSGQEMKDSYLSKTKGIKAKVNGDILQCTAKNKNAALITNRAFSRKIASWCFVGQVLPYVLFAALYLGLGIWELRTIAGEMSRTAYHVTGMFTVISLVLGVLLVYAVSYMENHFGQVPLEQLLYHLHTPLDGTDISSYRDVILLGVALTVAVPAGFLVVRRLVASRLAFGITVWAGFAGLILVAFGGVRAYLHFDIASYYTYTHESTQLYEEQYVDGRDVEITFPDTKRNLIYIFLESMEITYADTAQGGAMTQSYIPELAQLALEGNCFSDGTKLNGAYQVSGATYTMGALAAQTSGVPINTNLVSNETLNGTWSSENNYLPGVWSIGDILDDAGYRQEFLIGSDGDFAGRASYFKGHGNYEIADYNAAKEGGRIAEDYKVWWGYEDEKLFSFAEEDLLELASDTKPFQLAILTVDTHFTDGYVCDRYSNPMLIVSCFARSFADACFRS